MVAYPQVHSRRQAAEAALAAAAELNEPPKATITAPATAPSCRTKLGETGAAHSNAAGVAGASAAAPAEAAAAAAAAAAPKPPLSTFTLLISRRYILAVGSTDQLWNSCEGPQQQQQAAQQRDEQQSRQQQVLEHILGRDGATWRRLHSILLLHKQPVLQQRQQMEQHLRQQMQSEQQQRQQQQHQQQPQQHELLHFSRTPTWERIGSKFMTTEVAKYCLRQTLQLLGEAPEQQLSVSGLVGFLPLLCGFHLVAAVGARPAARLLVHHTVNSIDDLVLLPLFFTADTPQEAAAFCCSSPPTLHLLHSLQQQQQQAKRGQQKQQQQQPPEDQPLSQQQLELLQEVQQLCKRLSGLSFSASTAAAAAEDAKYRTSVLAYRADRGFYFCRTLCINLSLQQLAARRRAACAAAAAAAAERTAATTAQKGGEAARVAAAAAAVAASGAEFHGQYLSCELNPECCQCKRQKQPPQQQEMQWQQREATSRWHWSPLHREECRFLWNRELLSLLLQQQQQDLISEGFFLLLLHGSVQQQVLQTQGVHLQLLTISRRSAAFAGPRYRKRGLNDAGDAANEIEVEFICQATIPSRTATAAAARQAAASTAAAAGTPAALWRQVLLRGGGGFEFAVASHVLSRGSAPLLWFQDTAVIPSRPRIRRRMTDVNCSAIRRHMASLLQRYGAPLLLLNLLRSSPRAAHSAEKQQIAPLGFSAATSRLSRQKHSQQGLGCAAEATVAVAIEAANAAARKTEDSPSEETATATVAEQESCLGNEYRRAVAALNSELPAAVQLRFAAVDIEAARRGDPAEASSRVGGLAAKTLEELQFFASQDLWGLSPCQLQRGVCRLNCLDSLDRTNEVQLHMHRAFALRFLRSLPAAVTIDSALDEQVLNAIAVLTDASGDDVALQYGGSVAHRKRLEPLAWAAQLPVESCSADDPRDNLWGLSFEASTGSRCSSNNGSNGDGPQLRSQPSTSSLTADDAAAPEGPRSNDSTSTTGSSSSKPGGLFSGALVALKGVSSALAVQWVGRKGTTAAFVPLLPGLSTSLQRRYSNILEDGRKQQALNIWFSLYPPIKEGQQQPPIWRLEDGYDVYIHHNFLEPSFSPKDWWVLPLQRFFNGMRSAVSISHCCFCCCCKLEGSGSDAAAARGAAGTYSDEDLQAPAAKQPAAAAAPAANQTATKWLGCCRCRSGDIIAAQTADASTGFLLSSGPSWVLDFLSPECTGILLGCSCGKHIECSNSSSVSISHNDSCDNGACFGAGDDIAHLLDVFTYGPWRRKAANAAASSAASVLRAAPKIDSAAGCLQLSKRGLAAPPVAVTAAGSKHAYSSQVDASEASLRAALEDHKKAEPDESQKTSSNCSKVSTACGEQRKNLQACTHSRGRSLALLLPTLIDTATAAARALQCSYALQLRESEQLWSYTALQQMQEQQEKEERMGSSFISKWTAAHLVLQQRSCNSALQQRLLQAHIARRLTKYPRDVVASFELQRAAAAAAAAACCCHPPCKVPGVNRDSNALLFLLPPRAGETPNADEQKTDTTQQQQQVRQHQTVITFKGILKEQLRRTLQAYSQQRRQQHDKALKGLPYELQQQLQLCSDGEMDTLMDTLNCDFGAASSSSVTSCWHRASAAVSETMLQPIELHALQQEAHLLRLQRQQKQLEVAMLLPAMYAFAAVAAQGPVDKQLLHRVQQPM